MKCVVDVEDFFVDSTPVIDVLTPFPELIDSSFWCIGGVLQGASVNTHFFKDLVCQ